MAKKSKIAKNGRRQEIVARYAERRAELKEIIRRPGSTDAERLAAQRELRGQPRDASATRVRNRDSVDGRPRGYLRAFGLSRIGVRAQAHAGFLPGVRKSSW
ncbi:30S ribosomal protein S14 [Streptomyces sp. NPDC091292]|uniref:30S ribosomal protein S14 n=1 Tax=Streptomyces sp. NPDC091292 TaxID=3365991 RepID=UPI003804B187